MKNRKAVYDPIANDPPHATVLPSVSVKIPLFQSNSIFNVLQSTKLQATDEIRRETKDQILNVNEAQYIEHILSKYQRDVPEIMDSGIRVEDEERWVELERRTYGYEPTAGQNKFLHFVIFDVPFRGDPELFTVAPSQAMLLMPKPVQINTDRLIFEYSTMDSSPEQIKTEFGKSVINIKSILSALRSEVERFEKEFLELVTNEFRARKKQLLDREQLVASFRIPIKQSAQVSKSFVIPGISQRRVVVAKPVPSTEPYRPEFRLDDAVFVEIIRICQGLGVEMERHPSLHKNKGEEELRDQFLLMLSPHFHSTAGEVFNKQGKTDILIRHEKTNVFIAECKFWGGESGYLKTIDQLLSYLTWRDSKAAVLLFNQRKQQEPVLEAIRKSTPTHAHFVRNCDSAVEGTFRFDMHLPDDESRGVELAVLCFHFPKYRGKEDF